MAYDTDVHVIFSIYHKVILDTCIFEYLKIPDLKVSFMLRLLNMHGHSSMYTFVMNEAGDITINCVELTTAISTSNAIDKNTYRYTNEYFKVSWIQIFN